MVEPVEVHPEGSGAEGGKRDRQVPLAPEIFQEDTESDPKTDPEQEHARHDPGVREGVVKGSSVHEYFACWADRTKRVAGWSPSHQGRGSFIIGLPGGNAGFHEEK
jgi:hypothetical protein